MPEPCPRPGAADHARRGSWIAAGLVGLLALAIFAHDLAAEALFVDESAYLSQTYFADLWLNGDTNNPAWLDYPAYDLPPLPKYMIGLALRLGGYRRPAPSAARAWYTDTSSRFDPPGRWWSHAGPRCSSVCSAASRSSGWDHWHATATSAHWPLYC